MRAAFFCEPRARRPDRLGDLDPALERRSHRHRPSRHASKGPFAAPAGPRLQCRAMARARTIKRVGVLRGTGDAAAPATVSRTTKETSIELTLNVDGSGRYDIQTGVPFLNHMLELFTRHGFFDLDHPRHRRRRGRRPPHGRGRRSDARAGVQAGARRQGRHPPLRRGDGPARRGARSTSSWISAAGRFFAYDIKTKQTPHRHLRRRADPRLPARVRERERHEPARPHARGPEPAPHRRGDLQGHGARARPRDPARSARAGRALDQGNALRMNGWPIVGWATLAVLAIVAAILAVVGHGRGRASAWRFARRRGRRSCSSRSRSRPRRSGAAGRTRRRRGCSAIAASSACRSRRRTSIHLLLILAVAGWTRRRLRHGAPDGDASSAAGIAYVFLALMTLTSFDTTAAWLGPRRWRRLHVTGGVLQLVHLRAELLRDGVQVAHLLAVRRVGRGLDGWCGGCRRRGHRRPVPASRKDGDARHDHRRHRLRDGESAERAEGARARRRRRRRSPAIPTSSWARRRPCCRASARSAPAWTTCAATAWSSRSGSSPRAAGRSSASASACRSSSTRARSSAACAGLGILPGKIVRFAPDPEGKRKVPQMGWNALTIKKRAPHLAGLKDGAQVYFVHSYYPVPADPRVVATTTDYGGAFASSVWQDNVFATAVPPREEPGRRPPHPRQLRGARGRDGRGRRRALTTVHARDSGDRSEGRTLCAPGPRRHAARDRLRRGSRSRWRAASSAPAPSGSTSSTSTARSAASP